MLIFALLLFELKFSLFVVRAVDTDSYLLSILKSVHLIYIVLVVKRVKVERTDSIRLIPLKRISRQE